MSLRRPTAPGLDGVRAVAVALVALFHVAPAWLPGGYVGVDVFFVLSGFLITTVLMEDAARAQHFDLPSFWVRRARRLVPAATAMIIGVAALTLLVGRDTGAGLRWQVLGGLTWTSNWFQVAQGWAYAEQGEPPVLNHLWSLGIEEQFYLLWPALLALGLLAMSRRWLAGAMLALAFGSAALMGALYDPDDPTRAYVGTDTHVFGLLIGGAIALARVPHLLRSDRPPASRRSRQAMTVVGVGGLVAVVAYAAVVPWSGAATYRGGLLLASLASGAVVVAAANRTLLASALSVAPLRWVGARSYGIYLWHWPFIVFATRIAPPDRAVLAGVLAVGASVVVAAASYRFVETPMRTDGIGLTLRRWVSPVERLVAHRRRPAYRWVLAVAMAGVVLVGAATAVGTAPDQSRLQASLLQGQRLLAAGVTGDPADDAVAADQPPPGVPPTPATCRTVGTSVRVSAFGDSVLVAAAPELLGTMPKLRATAKVGWQYEDVAAAIRKAAARGILGPVVLIGTGTNGLVDHDDLDRLVRRQLAGHEVVLVSPYVPGRSWQKGALGSVRRVARDHAEVKLAEWHDAVAGRDTLLAADRVHPNERGARLYTRVVREALGGC